MRRQFERGSQLVEFALVLPILLVLVFGIIDFGVALFDKAVITNAAREGVRSGVVYRYPALTPEELQAHVTSVVSNYCSSYLITFGGPTGTTITGNWVTASSTNPLTVTVDYSYNYLVLANLIPSLGTLQLRGRTIMRME